MVEVNEELYRRPELLNPYGPYPYGQGWIARIRPTSREQLEKELKELMTAEEYTAYIRVLEGVGS